MTLLTLERYRGALLRKATRILRNPDDAHDVVQGLFVDLVASPEKDEGLFDLPYLYRAITNRCLTFLRNEKNRARLLALSEPEDFLASRRPDPSDLLSHRTLLHLCNDLDGVAMEVLIYYFIDELSQDEIASLVGLSRKTVGVRLENIRAAAARVVEGT